MGSCCTSESIKTKTLQKNPNNQINNSDNGMSPEQIESRRLEMAAQYEKKLKEDKYRNVSKQGQIEMKLKEEQAKRIEELQKNQNPRNFNLQYK